MPPNAPTVWDTATGKLLFRLEGHTEQVRYAVYSPDGKRIATSEMPRNRGGEVKLWDAVTGRELLSLKTTPNLRMGFALLGPSFSPDGHRLTLPGWLGDTPRIWDATPRETPAK